jgi:hypothetical protein
MRDWDWSDSRWGVRLLALLLAGAGAWARQHRAEEADPRMAAAVVQAFSEEAGFRMPPDYQIERVPGGKRAFAIRPDGSRVAARTVLVGGLTRRLYVDLVAAGAEDPGEQKGIAEAMEALRDGYGRDLGPDDRLALAPPGWQLQWSD